MTQVSWKIGQEHLLKNEVIDDLEVIYEFLINFHWLWFVIMLLVQSVQNSVREPFHSLFKFSFFIISRRLLPAYSSLVRFPQLVFIQDKKADYEKEVESLLQEAKNS